MRAFRPMARMACCPAALLTCQQTPETEHLEYSKRVPDESRMVKAFTRSSAGADVELVIDIRSPAACLVSSG